MEIKANCTVCGVQNYWHLTPQRAKRYLPLTPKYKLFGKYDDGK